MISVLTVALSCLIASHVAERQLPPDVAWSTRSADGPIAAPEGHAWIRWAPESDASVDAYTLERLSPGASGPAIRHVEEAATFIAGLPEGATRLRVRAVSDDVAGPWSEPLIIEVSYPSAGLVRILGSLGSLLLAGTAMLIIAGHRSSAGSRRSRPAALPRNQR